MGMWDWEALGTADGLSGGYRLMGYVAIGNVAVGCMVIGRGLQDLAIGPAGSAAVSHGVFWFWGGIAVCSGAAG